MSLLNIVLTILASLCLAVTFGLGTEEASGATKDVKENTSDIAVKKNAKNQLQQASKSPSLAGKPVRTPNSSEKQPGVLPKQTKLANPKTNAGSPMAHQRLKVNKKSPPKAMLIPKIDGFPHGMLEDHQRYDPRLNYRTAGVQDPRAPDLAHEHFQELDRNQDGRIDPVERAFGRLDMDRDLPNRHY